MGIFSFLGNKKTKSRNKGSTCRLAMESLEDRCLPSCSIISGHVFSDTNNNGLFDSGESAIANASIKLVDTSNKVVGTAITDAGGFYQFDHDATISTAAQTIEQTLQFPAAQTDFSVSRLVNQFDPGLGQLVSVEIFHNGTITSTIKVENTSSTSPASINATVSGTLKLTGPGFSSDLDLSANAGSFNASSFDQIMDFGGNSGFTFAPKSASGSKQTTLTGTAMTGFIGTGTVSLTEDARATSYANGGGNLAALLTSNGQSDVKVVYHYIPTNCLLDGDYTIVLNSQPAGYLPGKLSSQGTVLNLPPGVNAIGVTLSHSDILNNDFAELVPAKISGNVYLDADDNGVKNGTEGGISNVAVTLSGTDDLFNAINQTAFTDANGFYQFSGLRPGSYALNEVQPVNYMEGSVNPGSEGGVAGANQIAAINLGSGKQSTANNFGELLPAGLSGYVYLDANNNGGKDAADTAISGVTITLIGVTSQGPMQQVIQTSANGFYQFANLKPGTYSITETQPSGYQDGQNAIGTQGGSVGTNQFFNIALAMGVQGANNNFGEVQPADLAIVKAASAATVQIGDTFSYTLTVTNLGTGPAQNVVVTDTLPAGIQYLGAAGTGWTFVVSGGTITGTRTSMAAGETSFITINVQAPLAAGNVTNLASVTSSTLDPVPSNNTSSVTTTIYNQPGQVLPQTIPPLVTTPAILYKIQLLPGLAHSMDPTIMGRLTFVDGVYRTLFNRPASSAEQKAGLQQLQGGMSTAQFVGSLWNRKEHWSWEVTKIYRSILHRNPGAGELTPHLAGLQNGATLRDIRFSLLTSAEYLASHSTASSFILGFYMDCLKQVPDSLTQINLVQSMGALDASTMANNLLNTAAAYNQVVTDGFAAVLRRTPTAAEVSYWSGRLQAGQVSEAAFLRTLLSSNEFFSLARRSAK
jgi:uncharacterized repeat protein (TIGR01451 family)